MIGSEFDHGYCVLESELRGWKETDSMSDDARRKVYLMRKAADAIAALRSALEDEIDHSSLLGPQS